MKNFWNAIGIWFLIQLIIIGGAVNMNSIRDVNGTGATQAECEAVSPALAFIAGVLVPLASTTLVEGDFCWNQHYQNNQ